VSLGDPLTMWQRWVRQPQKIWLRRALFQVHLWSGIAVGLYILLMSITGSVLVYRNELYRASSQEIPTSTGSGPFLGDEQLGAAAARVYPGYRVVTIERRRNPDQAVDVWLRRGGEVKKRLFDPRSGSDLGDLVPAAFKLVSELIDLHDNLLAGSTGRTVNGAGALALLTLAVTGLAIWWPGVKTWRRSLTLPRGMGWRRWNWHLHSAIGFWSFAFTLVFALSGIYLCFPQTFQDLADRIEPPTVANAGVRVVDHVLYWLAFLHFGRIQGIGIPCKGPGLCDQVTKATWAIFGAAPAAMFVTGAIMWWNRTLRPRMARARRPADSEAAVASKF
jgi:uncharacterized iron-regulated membrane protein